MILIMLAGLVPIFIMPSPAAVTDRQVAGPATKVVVVVVVTVPVAATVVLFNPNHVKRTYL
jgi:hypothetical protein